MDRESAIVWNPYSPNYFDNPYEHLKQCREDNPIQKGKHGYWMYFSYEDVAKLLRSPDYGVSDLSEYFKEKEPHIFQEPNSCPFLAKGTKQWAMYLNNDQHKKIRAAMGKAIAILPLDEIISESLEKTQLTYKKSKSFDLVDYCASFIFEVVKRLFGIINYEDIDHVRKYSNLLARSQDLFIPRQIYQEMNEQFLWGKKIFSESPYYLELRNALEEEDLSSDDYYSIMSVSLMAAFETSKDNLSMSLYEILKDPGLMEKTCHMSNAGINSLIEELLRFSSPLQYTIRVNWSPLKIMDTMLEPGSKIFLCLASANRDPKIFSEPDRIIPNRDPNPHLSFGGGQHFCLGSTVARREMKHCLQPMSEFLKSYRLVEDQKPKWAKQIFMRTAKSIYIEKV